MRIVVVGGGAAGYSAAIVAKRVGAQEVVLIERTDMLGGLALVAGIGLCGSGPFAVLNEERELGGASLFDDVFFPIATHSDLQMPGFDRAMLYNVTKLDARMRNVLTANGINLMLRQRVTGAHLEGNKIISLKLADGQLINGDVFIDATGSATGIRGCTEFGYGCVGCILRCPVFGNPAGLVDNHTKTLSAINALGQKGLLGTSVLLPIASLSNAVQEEVKAKGYAYLKIPAEVQPDLTRAKKAGSYLWRIMAQSSVAESMLLVDVGGYVKVTANASARYAPSLRLIPGLEESSIAQPAAGGIGHLVDGLTMLPRKNTMEVDGFDNLLCAGIKSGHALFLMDVTCTAELAGYNSVRKGAGLKCLELPKTIAIGAFIAHVGELLKTDEGLGRSPQADKELLTSLGVYRKNETDIIKTIGEKGLKGIYRQPLNG